MPYQDPPAVRRRRGATAGSALAVAAREAIAAVAEGGDARQKETVLRSDRLHVFTRSVVVLSPLVCNALSWP